MEPRVEARPDQPYVGIRGTVSMQEIAKIADRLGEVFGWLGQRGIAPAGAPFFKYNVLDPACAAMEIEVGVPIASAVPGEGDVLSGVLPAGRYATVHHHGHPDGLYDVTSGLLAWASREGHAFDKTDVGDNEHWACRLEIYHSDPEAVPDMNDWDTDLAFKLAG